MVPREISGIDWSKHWEKSALHLEKEEKKRAKEFIAEVIRIIRETIRGESRDTESETDSKRSVEEKRDLESNCELNQGTYWRVLEIPEEAKTVPPDVRINKPDIDWTVNWDRSNSKNRVITEIILAASRKTEEEEKPKLTPLLLQVVSKVLRKAKNELREGESRWNC